MFHVESAALIVGGRLAPTAGWTIPTHTHEHWELVYCLKGSGRVDFPNASHRAQGYSLLVYPPGLPHAEVSSSSDPEEILYLRVSMEAQAPPGAHFLLNDPSGDIGWLCKHIVNECNPSAPHPLERYPETCLVYESFDPTPVAQLYTKALLYVVARELGGVPLQQDVQVLRRLFPHPVQTRLTSATKYMLSPASAIPFPASPAHDSSPTPRAQGRLATAWPTRSPDWATCSPSRPMPQAVLVLPSTMRMDRTPR